MTLSLTPPTGVSVVMPASALDTLSRLNIMYPMMFRVSSDDDEPTRSTFCGVLEFSAPEGVVFLPPWMLHTLRLHAGDLVVLSNVALPLGTFIRIQPQSVAFLDITDPRAVLEHSLRNFACLTVGDRVAICYNECIYELLVQEVRPDDGRGGICVLETDLQVDFSPPLGYEEPKGRSGATLSGTTTADTGTGVGIGIGSRGGGGEKSIVLLSGASLPCSLDLLSLPITLFFFQTLGELFGLDRISALHLGHHQFHIIINGRADRNRRTPISFLLLLCLFRTCQSIK